MKQEELTVSEFDRELWRERLIPNEEVEFIKRLAVLDERWVEVGAVQHLVCLALPRLDGAAAAQVAWCFSSCGGYSIRSIPGRESERSSEAS